MQKSGKRGMAIYGKRQCGANICAAHFCKLSTRLCIQCKRSGVCSRHHLRIGISSITRYGSTMYIGMAMDCSAL